MSNQLNRSPITENSADSSIEKSRVQAKEQERAEQKPIRWVRLRLFPIWLRVLLVIVALIVAVLVGLFVGYSVIGDGNVADTLKVQTWQHIFDIMNGKQ